MNVSWKSFRHRVEWFLVKLAAFLVPLCPRPLIVGIGSAIGSVAAVVDRAGRRVALSNVECAFGATMSPAQKRQLVRESYRHFARTMTDLFWSPRLKRENYSRYIDVVNLDLVQAEMKKGNGIVFACCHYSNFEWVAVAANHFGVPSALVTHTFKNPLLDPIFVGLRESSGQRVIAREGAVFQLFKTLRRGGCVAILTDLTLPAQLPTVAIDCFGLKTSVTFAHAWAHRRAGATIINVHCEPLPHGRYRVVFHPIVEFAPAASLQEIAQTCWNQFEPVVRRNPAPWLWMYKHWRYRPEAADPKEYPFYANVSPQFEKRLDESEKRCHPESQ
ncbi:MAG: Kdo2-lipid lauroyltransferase/acyltransferase [Verrucomicrobiota bacterium]|jgi:lauroyl/myristoyl acyltransferase